MRKLLYIPLIVVVAATACKKYKGPADTASTQIDNSINSKLSMAALINGVSWKTDSAYSYRVANSANDTDILNLMIVATRITDTEASTITFNISDYKGIGDYKIDPPVVTATYYAANKRHFASTGTFSIQSDSSGLLSGAFNFTADTVVVSEGSFRVALP